MLENIADIFNHAPLFALVLARISGLIAVAPMLGSVAIPMRIKALITLMFSVAVYPMVPPVIAMPSSLAGVAVACGGELLIGICMGFVLTLLFTGVELGAEMVSHQMGLSLAQLVNPLTEVQTTVLSQFYGLLTTLVYVLLNGHLILLRSLAQTFRTMPLLDARFDKSVIQGLVNILTTAFALGIRIAGPALIAIFLATLALGFVSRTMPQLNILAAGFPVRILLSFILLIASLGAVCYLFQDSLFAVFRDIGMMFV